MKKIFCIVLLSSLFSYAQSPGNYEYSANEAGSKSVFNKNQKFDKDGVELYDSNWDLKGHKRVGAGVMLGGAAGTLGLNLEVNVEPSEALVVGLGTGEGYNS